MKIHLIYYLMQMIMLILDLIKHCHYWDHYLLQQYWYIWYVINTLFILLHIVFYLTPMYIYLVCNRIINKWLKMEFEITSYNNNNLYLLVFINVLGFCWLSFIKMVCLKHMFLCCMVYIIIDVCVLTVLCV